MVTRHYGDHFVVTRNIESLSCTPETNIKLYVNFSSIKKKLNFCTLQAPNKTQKAKKKEFLEIG